MIGNKITAAEGRVFRRKSDGMLFGNVIYLGMTYPPSGEPYEELPEHFEEVDDPAEVEIVLLDEETLLMDDVTPTVLVEEQEAAIDEPVKRVVTMSDYRSLEKKVELLMKLIGGDFDISKSRPTHHELGGINDKIGLTVKVNPMQN